MMGDTISLSLGIIALLLIIVMSKDGKRPR